MTRLATGDIVQVYQRPLTKEGLEGRATVREVLSASDGDGILYRCMVEFDDEPGVTYHRFILQEAV